MMVNVRRCWSFSLLAAASASAFSTTGGTEKDAARRLNFHQVMEKVGKKILRPGGREATETLHSWGELTEKDSVIEIASGLGRGGMSLAQKYGCKVLLTDVDQNRLDEAATIARARGLDGIVSTRYLDMYRIDETLLSEHNYEQFDAAVVEASMTHLKGKHKEKLVRDLHKHCKQILVHEICLTKGSNEEHSSLKREMTEHLRIGFEPLPEDDWKDLLEANNYRVTDVRVGPIGLLHLKSIVRDEGPLGMAMMAWNLITQKGLRDRVLETRSAMSKYSDMMGYIILRGVREDV